MIRIKHGDCLDILREMDEDSVDLVYIDPPNNTKHARRDTATRRVCHWNRPAGRGSADRTVALRWHPGCLGFRVLATLVYNPLSKES